MAVRTAEGTISTWVEFFDSEGEAHALAQNERHEMNSQEGFEYVDHDVDYDLKAGSWKLSLRYIDSRPAGPEAA